MTRKAMMSCLLIGLLVVLSLITRRSAILI